MRIRDIGRRQRRQGRDDAGSPGGWDADAIAARARDEVETVPFWWHSIEVAPGVITPGGKSTEVLRRELDNLNLDENLSGRRILDVGAWDGYFSFACEERGAREVVALDHYVWSLELGRQQAYWQDCMAKGVRPDRYEDIPGLWQPEALPGRAGFDTARRLRKSCVRPVVADFMDTDLDALGTFDMVLYLGVLYHMEDPLRALRRIAKVCSGSCWVETEAIAVPEREHAKLFEFYEAAELNGDSSNWWAPTMAGLTGMLRASGFPHVQVLVGPSDTALAGPELGRYRAVVRADRRPQQA